MLFPWDNHLPVCVCGAIFSCIRSLYPEDTYSYYCSFCGQHVVPRNDNREYYFFVISLNWKEYREMHEYVDLYIPHSETDCLPIERLHALSLG